MSSIQGKNEDQQQLASVTSTPTRRDDDKSSCAGNSNGDNINPKKKLYSFREARKIARGHGFSNRREFEEYECPGAYQLPKNPHEVWREQWRGWDDWLGVPWTFEEGRGVARQLQFRTKEEYLEFFENRSKKNRNGGDVGGAKDTTSEENILDIDDDDDEASIGRLPYRPDLYYKNDGWRSWEDWLGS